MRLTALLQTVAAVIAITAACSVGAQVGPASAATSVAMPASSANAVRASNKKLRRAVLHALAKAHGLDGKQVIAARVSGGEVTLTGWVSSAEQVTTAGEVVQAVPGVIAVTNKIGVSIPR